LHSREVGGHNVHMKVVITGGHHTSAIPVIKEFRKTPEVQIFWFGHKYSIARDKNPTLEYREITALGVPFYDLKAGKLYRTTNIIRLLKIPFGFFQSLYLLKKVRPNVILSFGGYLAAPVVFAGWFLGIPSITHEQTVVTGYANKFVAKFTKKVLVTWEESKKYFPGKNVVTVGLPLRKEIFEQETNKLNLNPDLPTIYITAGKTGSHTLNKAVLEVLSELLSVSNVIHQCGDTSIFNDYQKLLKKSEAITAPGKYNLKSFVMEDEIGEIFAKTDLVVGRSGAHTIYELLALEKPAILIPLPAVSHNEQFENAALLYKAGLARILEQKDLSPKSLVTTVKLALENLDQMKLRDRKIKENMISDSAERIVNEVLSIVKK